MSIDDLSAENVYDEPSLVLPDPIYQEVVCKDNMTMALEQEVQIEIMKNYSYACNCMKSKACQSIIILNECPAYIQRS